VCVCGYERNTEGNISIWPPALDRNELVRYIFSSLSLSRLLLARNFLSLSRRTDVFVRLACNLQQQQQRKKMHRPESREGSERREIAQ
jgi:hypothetical protein